MSGRMNRWMSLVVFLAISWSLKVAVKKSEEPSAIPKAIVGDVFTVLLSKSPPVSIIRLLLDEGVKVKVFVVLICLSARVTKDSPLVQLLRDLDEVSLD